jgi:hypothetical protein
MDDGFRIARGVENMSCRFQLSTQAAVVVDLSVENDPDSAVFVVDWLVPGRQIDDAQPAHPQSHTVIDVNPLIVGSAVPDHFAHPMDEIPVALEMPLRRLEVAVFCKTCDATHELVPLPGVTKSSAVQCTDETKSA